MANTFNKGDVSEGILAAAITARFLSKTAVIKESDVVDVVKKLKKPSLGAKGWTTTTSFDSPNEKPKIVDEVICHVNLAEVNMKAFVEPKIYTRPDIKPIVKAAISYANGTYIREWADMMYVNNQKNKIEVKSEGLLDQTGTKVDLKIVIDGKQASVGVSLKVGDVKQFGQVGGSKWESMEDLFNPLGVKFTTKHETDYNNMLANKELAPALTTAYKIAYDQISNMSQKFLRKAIADFMYYHATSREENVVLVQLNKGASKVYDFEILEQKLAGLDIDVELTSGNTSVLGTGGFKGKGTMSKDKIPKLSFLIDGKPLVFIRLKLEGNRINSKGKLLPLTVRNYIEKGERTTELLT